MNDSSKQQPSLLPRRPEVERRGGVIRYVAVAMLALAAGVAGTLLAVRARGTAPSPAAQAGHEGIAMGAPGEPSREAKGNAVYISPARRQLIGVRSVAVTRRDLGTTIRTVGTLAYDETRLTHVHTKIAGWVERLFVDYVGKSVSRGQPLLTVYSPALVATQNEYLIALKASRQPVDDRFPEPRAAIQSLLASSRQRLKLWDVSDAQIAALERSGQVQKTLALYAPFDGVVLERNVFAGQYVTPEMDTLKIADLSTVWALGQIFEYESPRVKVGQEVEIEFPYGQALRRLRGTIKFIYPEVDPQTRRVKIRAEFRNPGLEFKPESYVTLVISSEGGSELAIPKEAVIDTGAKRYVILARPGGYFEPRDVELGQPTDEFYPVLRGIKEGDTVVTSAQFLIDSETNLQAAMQAMAATMPGMDMGGMDMPGMDMGGGGTKATEKPGEKAPQGASGGHAGHTMEQKPPTDGHEAHH
jgi:RND family efflux transporter MFP subunit